MATWLYRKNSGEVQALSETDPWTGRIDTDFWAVISDPPVPDGETLSPPKIYDGTEVRDATQAEIDNFAVVRASDENLENRRSAKGMLDQDEIFRKVLRALVEVIIEEINVLRQQHSLTDRTLEQAKTAIQNKIDAGTFD